MKTWTVTVTRNDVKNPYTFSRQEGKKYIRIALNIGVHQDALQRWQLRTAAAAHSYLRSAEYKVRNLSSRPSGEM